MLTLLSYIIEDSSVPLLPDRPTDENDRRVESLLVLAREALALPQPPLLQEIS